MTEQTEGSDSLTRRDTLVSESGERMRTASTASLDGGVEPPGPPPPERLGRYRLLEQIGVGAMGAVYAARDDALARKVAIKVLLRGAAADPAALRRLTREAQAMARVAHPNVVVVHEVGEADGLLFVAMELVEGVTLDRWCRPAEGPRPDWRARLDMFLQAGRGLAAAHEVGVVHRDFKPSNVIVDGHGRARVLDFGLARVDGEALELTAASVTRGALDVEVTRSGTMLGTPAYMPPEQFEGRPATPASDQFSFCVALYEALAGARPFAGRTPYALLQTIRSGQIRPPPRDTEVPAAVFPILARGLAVDPARRWPDMPALLAALERAVRPWRVRGRWLAFGVLAALASGFGLAALALRGEEPCAAVSRRLDGVADAARREQVRAALLATGKPYAEALAASVDAAIGRYADAWTRVAADSCAATRVVGDQSEAMLDLRTACLDRRLAGLDAAVQQLLTLDAEASQRALDLVDALEPLEPCSDREALGAAVQPPADPDVRARLAALERDRLAAAAMRSAGRVKEALALAEATRAGASELGFAPTLAEAALLVSRLELELDQFDRAAAHLEEATSAAAEAGRDDLLADAWLARVWQQTQRGARGDVLAALIRAAEVALTRAREPPRLAVIFHSTVGHTYQRQGLLEQARVHYDAALALLDTPDISDLQRLRIRVNRASLLVHTDPELARAELQAALAGIEELLGVGHPMTSNVFYTLGNLAEAQGDFAAALVEYEKARAIKAAEYGPDSRTTLLTDERIAATLDALGREDEALAAYEGLLARNRALHGDRHTQVSQLLNNMVALLLARGEVDFAFTRASEALAIDSAILGEDHLNVAIDRVNLAGALQARDEHPRALSELGLARETFVRTVGPKHVHVATTLLATSASLSALSRHDEAVAAVTEARALLVQHFGEDHPELADVDLTLAEVLVAGERFDEGLQRAHAGAERNAAVYGPHSREAVIARGRLGVCLTRARQLDRAVPTLEAAVADAEAAGLSARAQTSLRLDLAGALAARGDRERARDLATAALAALAAGDPLRAEAERLLAGR